MLLKLICQSMGPTLRRSASSCAFHREFNHLVQFSVNRLTEYFLTVHLAERADCYATVCLQHKV